MDTARQNIKICLLFTMVEDANRTVVALGDILSDSVYYYNREKNQIVPVTEEKRIV